VSTTPTAEEAGCMTVFEVFAGLTAPAILGPSAALSPTDIPMVIRVGIFLVVTAAVGALVYGIWAFLRTTPIPASRPEHDQ
jgi:hypothetical protein